MLEDGSVVIAAITSCTNTSNPGVMVAAGLLAQKAVARGLKPPAYVKTSMAPGSRVVSDYLTKAKLLEPLAKLGFDIVGYGCTTCIGNSGPLPDEVAEVVRRENLSVAAVLSGNRNFEGRIHPQVRAAYLASPPLVVAFALAGTVRRDLTKEPLGVDRDGNPVYLSELWPTSQEISDVIREAVLPEFFHREYERIFNGDEHWKGMASPTGPTYAWSDSSTYIREVPLFEDMPATPIRWQTSRRPEFWRFWAIRSLPITSPRPAQLPWTVRQAGTLQSREWRPGTSTATARAGATTKS